MDRLVMDSETLAVEAAFTEEVMTVFRELMTNIRTKNSSEYTQAAIGTFRNRLKLARQALSLAMAELRKDR